MARLERSHASRFLLLAAALLAATQVRPTHAEDPPQTQSSPRPESTPADRLAQKIDAYIEQKCAKEGVAVAPPADDAEYLRRVSIDVVGEPPRPKEVVAFLADRDPDKRRKKLDELLQKPEAARNWAEFWTDVMDREATTKLREDQFKSALRGWFESEFAKNTPFDQVTRRLIAAEGLTKDNGAAGFVISYAGADKNPDPQALAATTARVFMGLQIECAQCHNHPFAEWKRDDFLGLAAFFARARLDREQVGTRPKPRELAMLSQEEREKKLQEYRKMQAMAPLGIKEADSGELNAEVQTVRNPGEKGSKVPPPPANARAGVGDKPATFQVAPRFIVPALATVSADREGSRRELLGRLITSDQDPYFAKCCANRVWGRLTGRPLIAPTEDLADETAPHDPELLALIGKGFRELRYDHKAFVKAICLTEAYARSSRSRVDTTDKAEYAKLVKAEQLYAQGVVRPIDSRPLARALINASFLGDFGFEEMPVLRQEGLMRRFERIFGEANLDPKKYEETIPEALFVMNGPSPGGGGARQAPNGQMYGPQPQAQGPGIAERRRNAIKRLLAREDDERERVTRVYLAAVGRPARKAELEDALAYIKSVADPVDGYDDLLWALLNSAEFRFNR